MRKLCKLETFFRLMWDFFVAKLRRLNIRRHVTFPHLCIILLNSSITVTTIKAKVFILLKRLNHISNLHSWMVCSVLCFLKWLISDWLIDWLWLTNESINQETDWLVIYLWLLLVLEICMYFGDAFQIQNKCSNLSRSVNSFAYVPTPF